MRLTVVGTGYVGLVTGACFADVGNDVLCLDKDEGKVAQLRQGQISIHEPGLDEIVRRNLAAGRLRFSCDYEEAVSHANVHFIAVGTPTAEDGSADLRYVEDVARQLGRRLRRDALLVVKSTVPVGTNARVRRALTEELEARRLSLSVCVASNPEFLKEGTAIHDCMQPDRIVIGAEDHEAVETLSALYAPFNRNRERLILVDPPSAELAKYAANAMLATRISFMNELARLAERLGADIERVRHAIGADPRIGPSFLYAGAGYGGSCFPKDIRALLAMAREHVLSARVISAVHEVNEEQKHILFRKLNAAMGGNLRGSTIGIWGLAFKPNTDDVREAPALVLIRELLDAGARVRAFDPKATDNVRAALGALADKVTFLNAAVDVLDGSDALVVVTEWLEFRSPDFERLAARLRRRILVDGRNLYDPVRVQKTGLHYEGIGRGLAPSNPPQIESLA